VLNYRKINYGWIERAVNKVVRNEYAVQLMTELCASVPHPLLQLLCPQNCQDKWFVDAEFIPKHAAGVTATQT